MIQQRQLLEKAEHKLAQVSGTLKPDCLPFTRAKGVWLELRIG
jgi:hypothetical protein